MHTLSLEAAIRTSIIRAGRLTLSEEIALMGRLKREFMQRGAKMDAETFRVRRSSMWIGREFVSYVHGMARGR